MDWNPDLVRAIEASAERSLTKVSRTTPNTANLIADHLRSLAPELAAVRGLWFSGSNVWSFLYGEQPAADADIDCFFAGSDRWEQLDPLGFGVGRESHVVLAETLGIPPEDRMYATVKTGANGDLYKAGYRALYKGRKLDIWTGSDTVQDTLRDYPRASHAHCRAAFSFEHGLVVLPNEVAQ